MGELRERAQRKDSSFGLAFWPARCSRVVFPFRSSSKSSSNSAKIECGLPKSTFSPSAHHFPYWLRLSFWSIKDSIRPKWEFALQSSIRGFANLPQRGRRLKKMVSKIFASTATMFEGGGPCYTNPCLPFLPLAGHL